MEWSVECGGIKVRFFKNEDRTSAARLNPKRLPIAAQALPNKITVRDRAPCHPWSLRPSPGVGLGFCDEGPNMQGLPFSPSSPLLFPFPVACPSSCHLYFSIFRSPSWREEAFKSSLTVWESVAKSSVSGVRHICCYHGSGTMVFV